MNQNYSIRTRQARSYRPSAGKSRQTKKETILSYLSLGFLPLLIFLFEFILKLSLFGSINGKELLYTLLFSLSFGLGVTVFCRLFASGIAKLADNDNVIRPLTATLIGIVSGAFLLLFLVQYVYFKYFSDFFKWSTLGMAGDVTQYYREILATIAKGWYWILLFIVPVVLYLLFPARKMPSTHVKPASILILIAATVLCHFGAVAIIHLDDDDYGDKTYYTELFNASYAVKNFGLLTETRLDLKQVMFGSLGGGNEGLGDETLPPINQMPDLIITPNDTTPSGGEVTGEPEDEDSKLPQPPYDYNITNIDFESLINSAPNKTIRDMHEYFSSLEGSKQNKYTGYFKGKNLILITLEGFSYKVIDEELTPTLYKIANNGFVFKNFYNGLWGGSTATGEYSVLTGNFYNAATCLNEKHNTYQPLAFGNMFSNAGYSSTGYHNNSYTYYNRDKSHPNFGFKWVAIGNGLELASSSWPNSDYQLAQATVGDYASSDTPFFSYYMTVSGHALYTWGGNAMSRKHQDRVEDLPYSENVKAYIACNLEVEDMLTYLMDELEAAGTLDDTVFVITEDHYPYALEPNELAELYGLPDNAEMFSNFDLYRNFFTVYSTSMEKPVIVEEPCSTIDILPTVLNLFGIEYDSRLYTGTDILSETPSTVILNCDDRAHGHAWNWITRYGTYNTRTKQFTPAPGVEFASQEAMDNYVSGMNTTVRLKRTYSFAILDNNYYKYVFKK